MAENSPVAPTTTPPWTTFDTVAICAVLIAALVAHFWQLGVPDMLIYDEHIYVDEAYKYLRGEAFFEIHPPLAILIIAGCARFLGCNLWSWRAGSAVAGSALIPITYLLARRMFSSRGAAVLAALLMLCEGLFLQYSRLALINIIYLTLGAASYLALFRFIQSTGSKDRRLLLTTLGVLLGLGLGSKFAIPAITWLLVVGFLVASLLKPGSSSYGATYALGAIALVSGVSGIFFFLAFLPNYALGWWTGISSLTTYYHRVLLANSYYPAPLNHQDSQWWTWPLMFRPYKEWQQPDDTGMYLSIWGGGNVAIWWAAAVAIVLGAIRAMREGGMTWSFLIIGYLAYLGMFVPVHRSVYLYSYMPALYLGILALAGLLDAMWKETAPIYEQVALLVPAGAVSLVGLGYLIGGIASGVGVIGYAALLWRGKWSGKLVCAIVLLTTIATFLYFLPVWIPMPMTLDDIDARVWFSGSGLVNWK